MTNVLLTLPNVKYICFFSHGERTIIFYIPVASD